MNEAQVGIQFYPSVTTLFPNFGNKVVGWQTILTLVDFCYDKITWLSCGVDDDDRCQDVSFLECESISLIELVYQIISLYGWSWRLVIAYCALLQVPATDLSHLVPYVSACFLVFSSFCFSIALLMSWLWFVVMNDPILTESLKFCRNELGSEVDQIQCIQEFRIEKNDTLKKW